MRLSTRRPLEFFPTTGSVFRPQLAAGWAHIAHTLGLVKNRTLAYGARPEPALRIQVEGEIAQQADLLIASTADGLEELSQHLNVALAA